MVKNGNESINTNRLQSIKQAKAKEFLTIILEKCNLLKGDLLKEEIENEEEKAFSFNLQNKNPNFAAKEDEKHKAKKTKSCIIL